VTATTFALLSPCAAFVLAIWLDVRRGRRNPPSLGIATLHVLAAFAIGRFASWAVATSFASSPAKPLLVATLALPALVYLMLAGIWILRIVEDMIGELAHPDSSFKTRS
jgi:hypothetical protein